MEFKPIGHIESGFKFKNGTPRQPTVCGAARARLTINNDTYSNPEHSLEGLEQFSHLWVIFVFHKNNNPYIKAKVKPPRLNGARVGVFSTRSPYRLNPIGLTLAKLEGVEGATLHLSGVDMLDGTPVLDVKPYIPLYDQPQPGAFSGLPGQLDMQGENCAESEQFNVGTTSEECATPGQSNLDECSALGRSTKQMHLSESATPTVDSVTNIAVTAEFNQGSAVQQSSACANDKSALTQKSMASGYGQGKRDQCHTKGAQGQVESEEGVANTNEIRGRKPAAGQIQYDGDKGQSVEIQCQTRDVQNESGQVEFAQWIETPPFHKLSVRWTPAAEVQLQQFSNEANNEQYRLQFIKNRDEARKAVADILQGDPRSSYRRKKCLDRLYFFMVDVLHVTCWFNDDESVVEVVRIKPNQEKMMQKLAGIH